MLFSEESGEGDNVGVDALVAYRRRTAVVRHFRRESVNGVLITVVTGIDWQLLWRSRGESRVERFSRRIGGVYKKATSVGPGGDQWRCRKGAVVICRAPVRDDISYYRRTAIDSSLTWNH